MASASAEIKPLIPESINTTHGFGVGLGLRLARCCDITVNASNSAVDTAH